MSDIAYEYDHNDTHTDWQGRGSRGSRYRRSTGDGPPPKIHHQQTLSEEDSEINKQDSDLINDDADGNPNNLHQIMVIIIIERDISIFNII